MARTEQKMIKEATLTNNCPECFNQELLLQFFQKHIYTKLYHKTTQDITHKLTCKTCGSTIYGNKWTEDIERVFDYYQKMVKPEKKGTKFSALFYILMLVLIALVGAGVYFFMNGSITL